MKKSFTIILHLFLAGFLSTQISAAGTETSESIAELRSYFEDNVQETTLSNGVRVLAMKNTISPTFAGYIKLGVGSANEPFDRAGSAHFLEHLLFKGNTELGTKDYAAEKKYFEQLVTEGERLDEINRKLIDPLLTGEERKTLEEEKSKSEKRLELWQKLAGDYVISEQDSRIYSQAGEVGYNAYTTADVTNYQIKLPKNRLELWMSMESRRFIDPVFREFYRERSVVAEERRMRYDSRPSNLLYEIYLKTAYGFSPYGKPVIGFESNIERMKYSEVRDFFETRYIPSRMVITVVGDVEPEEVFALAEKYFGRIPKREEAPMPPIGFDYWDGEKRASLIADASPMMIKGWRRPAMSDPDAIIFDLIASLLTDGQTSRLYRRLVLEEKLAASVSAHSGLPGEKLPNQFAIFVVPFDYSQYGKIEEIIAEEIDKLSTEDIQSAELERLVNQYLVSSYKELQKNAGVADLLSYYKLLTGDYRYLFRVIDEVEHMDPDEIRRVVKTYFKREYETTVWLEKREG